jgi:hypothetical protein
MPPAMLDPKDYTDPEFWKNHCIVSKLCHYDDRMQRITGGKSYKIDYVHNELIVFKDDLGYINYLNMDNCLVMFNIKTIK